MKVELNKKISANLKWIVCDMDVRYWEDSEINGNEDDAQNPQMPCIKVNEKGDKAWVIIIDAETGQIKDWPKGVAADIHYKICDGGLYTFIDSDNEVLAEVANYVPAFLCPTTDGYGDYAIMQIDADGHIQNWRFFDNEELQRFLEGF